MDNLRNDVGLFLSEWQRMCDSHRVGSEYICHQCAAMKFCWKKGHTKAEQNEFMKAIQEWSETHPNRTYATDFIKKFPNSMLGGEHGYYILCRESVYGIKCTKEYDMTKCKECWCEQME